MSLNAFETDFDRSLMLHFLDATMNLAPTGFLCIFGVQYIMGRHLSFSFGLKPNFLEKQIFSKISSSFVVLET